MAWAVTVYNQETGADKGAATTTYETPADAAAAALAAKEGGALRIVIVDSETGQEYDSANFPPATSQPPPAPSPQSSGSASRASGSARG